MSGPSIRLLIIEDRPDDAELIRDQFVSADYQVVSQRVASADHLRQALKEHWDIILSDHVMPSFSSRGALKIVKETGQDTPFILISGSIGEREAVEMMRLGVNDYILKDNLDRLVVSAEREIREADNRRKRREAEEQLRKSERQLQAMYNQADKMNRMKDEFLATLSHELRTPLNIIMGNAEILQENAKSTQDEETKILADAIYRNAVIQTRLVNDLLDVSSIITGKMRFEPARISPSEIIHQVIETLNPAAKSRKIRIATKIQENSATLWADRNRFQQILWNLLSNAIKFTNEGGSVQLNCFKKGQSIILEVIDDGVGIDPDFMPWLFERFHQEDSSITRRHGGLGLGLSIVRNLVELHGGTIHAESAGKGRGAKFTVAMPYFEGEDSTQGTRIPTEEGEEKPLDGTRILLIEDSADARLLFIYLLERAGADVRDAVTAANARELLKDFVPDVIVSDIGLPEENGMEFIRNLRTNGPENHRTIPAIALTAYAREEEKAAALSAGFQIHVAKPVSAAKLVDSIRQLL